MAGLNDLSQVPLTGEHYDRLKAAERMIADTLPLCDKAGRCGINVQMEQQTLMVMQEALSMFEREFFPNGRPSI